ncbi:MAG: hypothetical protein WCL32_25660, partial [Planctomycetota bacterium]
MKTKVPVELGRKAIKQDSNVAEPQGTPEPVPQQMQADMTKLVLAAQGEESSVSYGKLSAAAPEVRPRSFPQVWHAGVQVDGAETTAGLDQNRTCFVDAARWNGEIKISVGAKLGARILSRDGPALGEQERKSQMIEFRDERSESVFVDGRLDGVKPIRLSAQVVRGELRLIRIGLKAMKSERTGPRLEQVLRRRVDH